MKPEDAIGRIRGLTSPAGGRDSFAVGAAQPQEVAIRQP